MSPGWKSGWQYSIYFCDFVVLSLYFDANRHHQTGNPCHDLLMLRKLVSFFVLRLRWIHDSNHVSDTDIYVWTLTLDFNVMFRGP
jgi:hypothetical protein